MNQRKLKRYNLLAFFWLLFSMTPTLAETHKCIQPMKGYVDAIYDNADYPSSLIQKQVEVSEKFWGAANTNLQSYINSLRMFQVDGFTIQDLNQSAAETWKKILSCNDQNLNLARKSYFNGKICSLNSNSEAIASLQSLTKNFHNFLLSSERILFSQFPKNSRIERDASLKSEKILRLYNIHPLLAQIAIQEWITISNLERLHQSLDPFTFTHDLINLGASLNKGVDITFSTNSSEKYFRLSKEEQRTIIKILLNSLAFVSGLIASPNENEIPACSIYGLWPALNQASLQEQRAEESSQLEVARSILTERVQDACGYEFSHRDIGKIHSNQLRRLFILNSDFSKDMDIMKLLVQKSVNQEQVLICE